MAQLTNQRDKLGKARQALNHSCVAPLKIPIAVFGASRLEGSDVFMGFVGP